MTQETNTMNEPKDLFCFGALKPFQKQFKKPIEKNNKTLKQSATLKDTDITDNHGLSENKRPQSDDLFFLNLSLTSKPSTSSLSDCRQKNCKLNSETANWCTLFNFRQFPKTSIAAWTPGLVKVQIKKIGTHLRLFLHDTAENWFFQVHFFAYARYNQSKSLFHVSPNVVVFNTQPHIPLRFQLHLSLNQFRKCIADYCLDFPPHSQYQSIDLISLFHSIMLKQVS